METTAIQRFMALVKQASQAHSRDLRLAIEDAATLAAEIGWLLAQNAQHDPKPSGGVDGGRL